MDELFFEWDANKNITNQKKHHISFEEAQNEVINMREEYDFSTAKKNPYAKRLKKQITINIDAETVEYFKAMSSHSGIPYQTLINLYLADCAANKRELAISWS